MAEAVLPLGLPASELPAFIGGLATGDIASIVTLPGVTPTVIGTAAAALQRAWAESAAYGWYSLIPVVVIGIISCLCLKGVKEQMTDQIDGKALQSSQHRKSDLAYMLLPPAPVDAPVHHDLPAREASSPA